MSIPPKPPALSASVRFLLTAASAAGIAVGSVTAAIAGSEVSVPQRAKINTADGMANGEFGQAVALSGDTLVVGAPDEDQNGIDSGAAYVFLRDAGTDGRWRQVAELFPADGRRDDRFGESVAIDGDTVAVGARGADPDGVLNGGAVYVYRRDQGGSERWGLVDTLTVANGASAQFGLPVAIENDLIVAGKNDDDVRSVLSGAAYVFRRVPGGADRWTQVDELTPDDSAAGNRFGSSLSISRGRIAVGAQADSEKANVAGAAYLFDRASADGNDWRQTVKLTADDPRAGGQFGTSVALKDDVLAVGAFSNNGSGSAYVFTRERGLLGRWRQTARLRPAVVNVNDRFGISVGISNDLITVGAENDDDLGTDSGSAFLFSKDKGGIGEWGLAFQLNSDDASSGDRFGNAVSMSGLTAVIGARLDDERGENSGSVYVFRLRVDVSAEIFSNHFERLLR